MVIVIVKGQFSIAKSKVVTVHICRDMYIKELFGGVQGSCCCVPETDPVIGEGEWNGISKDPPGILSLQNSLGQCEILLA
jgi:hypothetical protein